MIIKMAVNYGSKTSNSRRTYTLEFKLGVLEWMKNHCESTRATARRFGVHRRMVQRWKESELKLNQAYTANGAERKKIHKHKQPLYQELEEKMLSWFISHRKKLLCDSEIKTHALSIAHDIGLDNFKASSGWISSFKKRHSTLKDATRNCSSSDRLLAPHILSTALPLCSTDSFLTHTSSNELINLHFSEGAQLFLPQNDTFVYYDYQAPEHNYCKAVTTKALIHTVRLSGRSMCSSSRDECTWTDSSDQAVAVGHEETIGEEFTETNGIDIVVSREKPARDVNSCSNNNFAVAFPSLDIDGVLTIASRTYQPEFNFGPELVVTSQ